MPGYKFHRDDDGVVIVHTDGSCLHNGTSYARAGIGVWFSRKNSLNASERVDGRQTSNVAEIQAARRAIEIALENDISELAIFTDSKHVVDGMNKWVDNWKDNNWRTYNGNRVRNCDEYQLLDQARDEMNQVRFVWLPGHSGIFGNAEAHDLAVRAAKNLED